MCLNGSYRFHYATDSTGDLVLSKETRTTCTIQHKPDRSFTPLSWFEWLIGRTNGLKRC
jgi:hypothetical protein